MENVNTIIAEDHYFYRKGLISVLNDIGFINIVGEAENGKQLIEITKAKQVDIILTDIKMPIMDGVEAINHIKKDHPDIKILVLSMISDEIYLKKMIELGVNGFILKNTDKAGLERALNAILEGKQYFSEEFLPYFTNKYISAQSESNNVKLTKRELEILQHISDGLTNKEIAEKLFISIKTAINHRTNILSKTGSKNTASLIKYAYKNKLIKM